AMATSSADVAEDRLPTTLTLSTISSFAKPKKLTLIPLIFMIYFEVSGGPYSEEPTVEAAGPLLAILGFVVFSFVWSIPEALITSELSTSFPGDGGFVLWADRAFGPFFGSLIGTWRFLSGVIGLAAYPAQCIGYLTNTFTMFSSGLPRILGILIFSLVAAFLNFIGLAIVGYASIGLAIVSLLPFIVLSVASIHRIQPHRWISLGQKGVRKDWNLFMNTIIWNLNNWDAVSTMAGEVENPKQMIPKALFWTVVFTCLAYVIPLVAVTGAIPLNQSEWQSGFMADAAGIIAGEWLKIWLEIGSVFSCFGLFEAQLSTCTYQLVGMTELALLPSSFAVRVRKFNTPWISIAVSTAIAFGVSFLGYTSVISSANFLYSLSVLLEFASFLWLRHKMPEKVRPYKVPLRLPGLVLMCLIPAASLIFLMVTSSRIVFLISGVMTAAGIGFFMVMKFFRSRGWLRF
ncbi:hypothetical protein M569_10233, partial [Genlisea aurea]